MAPLSRLPRELLAQLYEAAQGLVGSQDRVMHYWGIHLLDDWRGLRLLAEKSWALAPITIPVSETGDDAPGKDGEGADDENGAEGHGGIDEEGDHG
jgi:hypothetical protein